MNYLQQKLKRQREPLVEEKPDPKSCLKRNQAYKSLVCSHCASVFIEDEDMDKEEMCVRCRWLKKILPFVFSKKEDESMCDCCDSYLE